MGTARPQMQLGWDIDTPNPANGAPWVQESNMEKTFARYVMMIYLTSIVAAWQRFVFCPTFQGRQTE